MAIRFPRFLTIALAGTLILGACKKRPPESQSTQPPVVVQPSDEEGGSFSSEEFVPAPIPEEPVSSDIYRGNTRADDLATSLDRIHFEYDRSTITPESREKLEKNAAFLRLNPGVRVEITGHCDERGSTNYNIALGERRAQAAHRYLLGLGLDRSRFRVVSFGEDRPLSYGHTEYDYALNRRVEFRPLN